MLSVKMASVSSYMKKQVCYKEAAWNRIMTNNAGNSKKYHRNYTLLSLNIMETMLHYK